MVKLLGRVKELRERADSMVRHKNGRNEQTWEQRDAAQPIFSYFFVV